MRASIKDHYSLSPASGFWIVEYGDKFVGLIAIDASTEDDSTKRPEAKTTATIRHFYVQGWSP